MSLPPFPIPPARSPSYPIPFLVAFLTHYENRGLITPPLIQHTGYGAYIFFAIFCAASFAWTWLFVPETKGKTLEEMDRVFGDEGLSLVEEERRERIAREIMGGGGGGIGGESKEGVV